LLALRSLTVGGAADAATGFCMCICMCIMCVLPLGLLPGGGELTVGLVTMLTAVLRSIDVAHVANCGRQVKDVVSGIHDCILSSMFTPTLMICFQ
jgi:hypothetical protein